MTNDYILKINWCGAYIMVRSRAWKAVIRMYFPESGHINFDVERPELVLVELHRLMRRLCTTIY